MLTPTEITKIFEEFAYHMLNLAQSKRITRPFVLNGKFYAFDSTTIDLCMSMSEWTYFCKTKSGIKVHTLFDVVTQIPTYIHITEAKLHDVNAMDEIPYKPIAFYIFDKGYYDLARLYRIQSIGSMSIIRAKNHLKYEAVAGDELLYGDNNVLLDQTIRLTGQLTMEKYPNKIRRVIYLKKKFIFFTNAMTISPVMVAELYHNRWQIELFFKWIKQHLKIKKFWGTSANAVRIQIYSAIIVYCMMAIVQKKMDIERSIYEMLQIVSISITDTTDFGDLFGKPNYNIVNELDDSTEITLFKPSGVYRTCMLLNIKFQFYYISSCGWHIILL